MSVDPGLRLPAEWEPQAGVLLAWPHAQTDWASELHRVEPVFRCIALEIARREPVIIICPAADKADAVRQMLLEAGAPAQHIFTAVVQVDDTWARDFGPVGVLTDEGARLNKFTFNGWGNRYPAQLDDAVVRQLAAKGTFGETAVHSIDLVLEGGSIDCDGAGTLLTTSACLLHLQRNPGHDRNSLHQRLADSLGIQRILWLDDGCLEGDDTDSHIDMLARFTDAGTIAYQGCDEAGYACYASLAAMETRLRDLRSGAGKPYRLKRLPWPQPRFDGGGKRLPASYANFLVINGAVLVPQYEDRADPVALDCLRDCFPGRNIIGIDCLPLIEQNGSLHCVTMQLPAGTCLGQALE